MAKSKLTREGKGRAGRAGMGRSSWANLIGYVQSCWGRQSHIAGSRSSRWSIWSRYTKGTYGDDVRI